MNHKNDIRHTDESIVSSLASEVSVGVTFASLMAAVALFFTGVLVAQYSSFDITIRVPLLFLFISTLSYIFSASIYSNAGEEITTASTSKVHKYLIYSNIFFEFGGTYLLIISIPLVMGAVTNNDNFLRVSTTAVTMIGMTLYYLSNFSIIHKECPKKSKKYAITFSLILLSVLLYLSQYTEQVSKHLTYNYIALVTILYVCALVYYFCKNSKQYKTGSEKNNYLQRRD